MKRILLALALCLSLCVSCAALADGVDDIDLSGLSLDELVALRERVQLAMWETDEWQEVTVPLGLWKVGEDIPAGHWTITAYDGKKSNVRYGDELYESGDQIAYGGARTVDEDLVSKTHEEYDENECKDHCDIDMKDGFYVCVEGASVVFTPYQGKPSLGFK